MKRTEPDGQPRGAEELMHPLAHFLRGLIGKCHGEDLFREDATGTDEVRDTVCNDPRFARSCTGENQERAIAMLYGFLLRRIELSLKDCCHVPESSSGPA